MVPIAIFLVYICFFINHNEYECLKIKDYYFGIDYNILVLSIVVISLFTNLLGKLIYKSVNDKKI